MFVVVGMRTEEHSFRSRSELDCLFETVQSHTCAASAKQ